MVRAVDSRGRRDQRVYVGILPLASVLLDVSQV
jgi:hypothetical protein